MTDKDFEKLFKQSEEITPRADLKNEILAKAKQEMKTADIKSEKKAFSTSLFTKRLLPIAACFVLVFILIGGMIGLGNEKYQTVYIDVNPSTALHVNRFGKVNGVEYINEDAKKALDGIKLKGLSPEDAIEKMLDVYEDEGYFDSDAEIYISAVSNESKNTDKLLAKLTERAEKIKGDRNYSVNTTKLTIEDKTKAQEHGISPGKYRIISEITEKHSEYTVEDLKDKPMAELEELLTKDKGNSNKSENKPTGEDRAQEQGNSPGKDRIISEIIEKHPEYKVEDLQDKPMVELEELLTKDKGNKK